MPLESNFEKNIRFDVYIDNDQAGIIKSGIIAVVKLKGKKVEK